MDEFKIITFLAQVSLIKPVTNAWSERGANTVKRVKSCRRSTMINDLLNALLNISINGPAYNSNDTKQLISEAAVKFESSKRQKKAKQLSKLYQTNISKYSSNSSSI